MKRLATSLLAVLCFLNTAISQCKEPCIDTIQPGLKLLGKTIVTGSDCLFTVEFCIRKKSIDAHHVDFAVYHTHGNLQETVDISRLPVDSAYCKIFSFIANCNSTASFVAVGKTKSKAICGIVSDLIILPIRLLSFTGEFLKNGMLQLNWQTATEANSSHFIIQESIDGKSFINLGIVKASGESRVLKSYSFQSKINSTTSSVKSSYYRLVMTDMDGSFSFSPVIQLKNSINFKLDIFPNPVVNQLTMQQHGLNKEIVQILNLEGTTLPLHWINENTLDVSELPPGIYFLRYQESTLRFLRI